jgi:hypothetical protein
MRRRQYVCRRLVNIVVMAVLLLSLPAPAMADGGPILRDPQLWAQLEEGQQIAVVRLGSSNTAQVDLFISMLDRSGVSHEIVFFLPLGTDPSDFSVTEETSLDFDRAVTEELDRILLTEARQTVSYRRSVRWSLLLGTLFINGAWSWPLWLLWSLAGCAAPGAQLAPIATYETESSQVAIYGMDEDTDLQALIETTGLAPAVQETLARLEGQQIAVITLQTQPPPEESGSYWQLTGQPGIHLAWTTTLVSHSAEATYAYPLGTGSAWAHPIEITRVYVVAPTGIDFELQYPKLGSDRSGFSLPLLWGQPKPRIMDADAPAYAVENAAGDFGRIWRVTYMYSNSAEDVVITRLPEMSRETLAALRWLRFQQPLQSLTYVVGLLVALLVWLVAWRYIMPRILGMEYHWLDFRLYRDALGWALLYPLTNGAVLAVAALLVPVIAGASLLIAAPVLFVTLLGVISIFFFVRWSSRTLGVLKAQAAWAYIAVTLIANVVYLVFAIGYTALVGAS